MITGHVILPLVLAFAAIMAAATVAICAAWLMRWLVGRVCNCTRCTAKRNRR